MQSVSSFPFGLFRVCGLVPPPRFTRFFTNLKIDPFPPCRWVVNRGEIHFLLYIGGNRRSNFAFVSIRIIFLFCLGSSPLECKVSPQSPFFPLLEANLSNVARNEASFRTFSPLCSCRKRVPEVSSSAISVGNALRLETFFPLPASS